MARLWSRRRFLHGVTAVGATALAGCIGGMPHDAVIATEPVDSVPESARIIEFTSLPADEQRAVREAIETGVYHECRPRSGVIKSFANRVASPGQTYLVDGADSYGLWVRVTDLMYASSGSPPSQDLDCGWF